MAGGPTTTALALAVAGAGGFPFLVGGYKTPEVLAAEITALQASGHPFGVNLFVPIAPIIDEDAFRTYVRLLQPDADRYGLTLDPLPAQDNDSWEQKLALLIQNPVPVISLTFALPEPAAIASLQRAGSRVLASVTTVAEAHQAEAAGVDGLIVQGPSAGGHSATFDPERRIDPVTTEELVRTIRAESSLPIIAAGGIDGPETVRRLLDAGAEAAAVGTLLLLADEAAPHQRTGPHWPTPRLRRPS